MFRPNLSAVETILSVCGTSATEETLTSNCVHFCFQKAFNPGLWHVPGSGPGPVFAIFEPLLKHTETEFSGLKQHQRFKIRSGFKCVRIM